MWHNLGRIDHFFKSLIAVDEQLAEQVRQQGCPCGGRLHRADYPRKPRGVPAEWEDAFCRRISFCCAERECRRRWTPPSVRFFGRRVYIAAVVIMFCARWMSQEEAGCSRRTGRRWVAFFREKMVNSRIWQSLRTRLMPPVDEAGLPASLLARFGGDKGTKLRSCLEFLAPITTRWAEILMDG